jgi:hypothetical protein
LQQRLIDLVAAHAYFAGLTAEQLLTEKVADLGYQVENALLPLGFGVVVTTASGRAGESSYELLTSDEELNVSITHNPTIDAAHDALEAQWAAIQAIQGKEVVPAFLGARTERDYFRVTAHQRRFDGPVGCNVREIHVRAGLRLL